MSTPAQPQAQPDANQTSSPLPSTPAERTRRQAGLFFGGAVFVLFSAAVTRRSLARRYRNLPASMTPQAQPGSMSAAASMARSTNPTSDATLLSKGAPTSSEAQGYSAAAGAAPTPGAADASDAARDPDAPPDLNDSGPLLAIEALTLATLNVVSWGIMLTGAALWWLDIGNMEDLRRLVRGGLGVDGTGRNEQQLEEELEEWIVGVLARKEKKDLVREEVEKEMAAAWRNERGKER